jgi:hypothetical protein
MAAILGGQPGSGGLTPYAARVHPAPATVPVRRTPPVPAIAAVVLALVSAGVPALFGLLALAFSGGRFEGGGVLLFVVPVVLLAGLGVGAVLLLLGRSWLALALSAGALTALVLTGYLMGGWGGGSFGVLTLAIPLITTVLTALPRVRGWVAARRQVRRPS